MRVPISERSRRLIKANTGYVLAISRRCVLMISRFIREHQIWSSPRMDEALPFLMTAVRSASSLRKSLQSRCICSVLVPLLPDICNLDLWTPMAKGFIAVKTRPRAHCSQFGYASSRATRSNFFFQAEDGIRGLYVTGVQTCALPI